MNSAKRFLQAAGLILGGTAIAAAGMVVGGMIGPVAGFPLFLACGAIGVVMATEGVRLW